MAIAPASSHFIKEEVERLGVTYREIPLSRTGFNPFMDLIYLLRLIKIVIKYRPTHILPYTIKPVIYASLVGSLFRKAKTFPLITGLGYLETEGGGIVQKLMRLLIISLYKVSLRRVDGIIFQNSDDKNYFYDNKFVRQNTPFKIVNGSGVNVDMFKRSPVKKNPVRFLLVARLIRSKGVEYFIKAASVLKERYSNVEFHIIGQLDDKNPDSIDKKELDIAVEKQIIVFHGFQNDVREILAESSVFVLPSYYREGVPRTILEAMAMGKPIITTDNVGCRDTVRDGENGFLIPKRQLAELVEAMEKFLNNPDLIESMGNISYSLAKEKFDVLRVNNEMLRFMGIS